MVEPMRDSSVKPSAKSTVAVSPNLTSQQVPFNVKDVATLYSGLSVGAWKQIGMDNLFAKIKIENGSAVLLRKNFSNAVECTTYPNDHPTVFAGTTKYEIPSQDPSVKNGKIKIDVDKDRGIIGSRQRAAQDGIEYGIEAELVNKSDGQYIRFLELSGKTSEVHTETLKVVPSQSQWWLMNIKDQKVYIKEEEGQTVRATLLDAQGNPSGVSSLSFETQGGIVSKFFVNDNLPTMYEITRDERGSITARNLTTTRDSQILPILPHRDKDLIAFWDSKTQRLHTVDAISLQHKIFTKEIDGSYSETK